MQQYQVQYAQAKKQMNNTIWWNKQDQGSGQCKPANATNSKCPVIATRLSSSEQVQIEFQK